jgi:hypothetical protein
MFGSGSYRFFLGQAALLKKDQNVDYKYDPKNLGSSNVMDTNDGRVDEEETEGIGAVTVEDHVRVGVVLERLGHLLAVRSKNYPDPNMILDRYGADALRLFLINSPVVRGDSLPMRFFHGAVPNR